MEPPGDNAAQRTSATYRLAVEDIDFLQRDEMRPIRLALEYAKVALSLACSAGCRCSRHRSHRSGGALLWRCPESNCPEAGEWFQWGEQPAPVCGRGA